MSRLTKALIPCGGKGTRMASLTKGAAKELLPIGGVPLVLRVMEECAASGVQEVLVVSAPGKEDVDEAVLSAAGGPRMPAYARVVVQKEARGLADAIRLGRDFAGADALGVALPDNLFVGDKPALAQLFDIHQVTGSNVVAIVELNAANKDRYGPTAIYPGKLSGDQFVIERIPDKGPRDKTFDLKGAESAFTGVGRYVFLPDVFATIDEVDRTLLPGKELDDIPVMQKLLGRRKLTGCRIRGDFLDVGLPSGYLEADERFRSGAV
ncbi:MAG TPA: sugar phosphate nucleotidyltransferase [Gemmatimonadaceae bacterium]|nr:sugar phosphate nucleotidyltransferase [Gemmatimonadaceae bacterium]